MAPKIISLFRSAAAVSHKKMEKRQRIPIAVFTFRRNVLVCWNVSNKSFLPLIIALKFTPNIL
jgi:hypothetical protein